jgi:WD repeat-containing protein 55
MGFISQSINLSSELFALALHPTEPVLAVGLSKGHVQSYRLPKLDEEEDGNDDDEDDENNSGILKNIGAVNEETRLAWGTRRHKEASCRCLSYSIDGSVIYSAGSDGLLKAASSETGRVLSKIAPPLDPKTSQFDCPTVLHALSPQTLLLATDSSALHLYDLRENNQLGSRQKPSQTHYPHDDYISSLTPLPPTDASTSGYSKQWVTTGGTTLAVTDLRRGVLVKSEDQEEELLSSAFVSGLSNGRGGKGRSEKVLVGGAGGVLTLWERGSWQDQGERIIVDRQTGGGESIDAIAVLPEEWAVPGETGYGKFAATGLGDGTIRFVKIGANKVVGERLVHDEIESCIALGVDVGGRLISGGGNIVRIWSESLDDEEAEDDEDDDEEGDESGEDNVLGKRTKDSDDDDSDEEDSDSSGDEKGDRKRRKKRKRNRGKDRSGGPPSVLGFKGMD